MTLICFEGQAQSRLKKDETKMAERRKTRRRGSRQDTSSKPVNKGLSSGSVQLLTDIDKDRIHQAALEVLETVGFAEAPDFTRERLIQAGCVEAPGGRITFPRQVVEDAIARANTSLVLYGQSPEHDVELSGSRTYYATGCGSILLVDAVTRETRSMTAADIYDFARIADALDNIDVFHRCGTPTDVEDIDLVDLNLFYACISGTSKPVSLSWFNGENVKRSVEMMHDVLGGEAVWRARPCVSNVCCFVVPPLKFAAESCLGLEYSVAMGMPVHLCSSGQLGATSPVTFAGSIVQCMAEVLGGLVYALAVSPDAKVFLGTWPLVSDLRTGAAAAGSGEQALLSSAACQMSRYYNLPNGTVSGISDSKLPDAQSGAEKALQHCFIGNSGGNLLYCGGGSLATGLGNSQAGLVIDNDIIAMAKRTIRGFSVDDGELAVDMIRQTCIGGEGHYLGDPETLARMKSSFAYPEVADRMSLKDWSKAGGDSILDHATRRANNILSNHFPAHIRPEADAKLRRAFECAISPDRMRAGDGPRLTERKRSIA